MPGDHPALFDTPGPERVATPDNAGRGRRRETYARTVVADVTVHDDTALRAAALQVLDNEIVIDLPSDDVPLNAEVEEDLPDLREEVMTSAAAREFALAACPATETAARADIERSFAAIWHWAASAYAPLDEVPGITWSPVSVSVEQVMARSRPGAQRMVDATRPR